jgi:hypothetical protein
MRKMKIFFFSMALMILPVIVMVADRQVNYVEFKILVILCWCYYNSLGGRLENEFMSSDTRSKMKKNGNKMFSGASGAGLHIPSVINMNLTYDWTILMVNKYFQNRSAHVV